MQIERTKLMNQKVLYHFAIFAIINEKLITKNLGSPMPVEDNFPR